MFLTNKHSRTIFSLSTQLPSQLEKFYFNKLKNPSALTMDLCTRYEGRPHILTTKHSKHPDTGFPKLFRSISDILLSSVVPAMSQDIIGRDTNKRVNI